MGKLGQLKCASYVSYSVCPAFNLQGWVILAVLQFSWKEKDYLSCQEFARTEIWENQNQSWSVIFLHIKKQCKLMRTSDSFSWEIRSETGSV